MNHAMTLTPAELDILGDAHQTLAETTRRYREFSAANRYDTADMFEEALRLKITLDMFEELSKAQPGEKILAFLINGECQLRELYSGTPLRHNPFLSHWVEAVQRLEGLEMDRTAAWRGDDGLSTHDITVARLLWIKNILMREDKDIEMNITPIELGQNLVKSDLKTNFDLRTYKRMLEEEGIYEAEPESEIAPNRNSGAQHSDLHDQQTTVKSNGQPLYDSFEQWKDSIPRTLSSDRERAIFELTRLPVELSSLDYLTTLLTNQTLEKHLIEPDPLVTQYIQHALRMVERMERPPSNSQVSLEASQEDCPIRMEKDLEYGKEAQSRAVRLLLLFIKSLIRKGLVAVDVLYFEIQEICVRYVWIKEVREFRSWVEQGLGEDGAA